MNPLNLDWTGDGERLFAMEKDGRALIIDGSNGSIEEDLFISGNKQPGEVWPLAGDLEPARIATTKAQY